MAIFGFLPDWTIMAVSASMTAWIIGGGFYFLPSLVFHNMYVPPTAVWALSLCIAGQVLVAFWQGMTVKSYYEAEPVAPGAGAGSKENGDSADADADAVSPGCHSAAAPSGDQTDVPRGEVAPKPCCAGNSSNHAPPAKPRTCTRCNTPKPSHVHHCSMCKRCIDGMDHHCQFLNSCIGAANMRHFLRYVGWVSIACTYVAGLAAYALYNVGLHTSIDIATLTEENAELLPKVGAFVLAFPFSLVPAAMPVVGIKNAALLAVAVTLHFIGAAAGYAFDSPEYYVTCLLVSAGLAHALLFYFSVLSLGLPVVLTLAVSLFFTDNALTFWLILLLLSAMLVAFLTYILLDANLARLQYGRTTIDALQGKPETFGREKEFIRRAFGCAEDAPDWHIAYNFMMVPM